MSEELTVRNLPVTLNGKVVGEADVYKNGVVAVMMYTDSVDYKSFSDMLFGGRVRSLSFGYKYTIDRSEGIKVEFVVPKPRRVDEMCEEKEGIWNGIGH